MSLGDPQMVFHPEGQAAVVRAAAAPPPTSEEARQQALVEGLTLCVADNTTGYFGVYHQPGQPRPYKARVKRGGKYVHLGYFATAEEAALCIARTPEGLAAAAERAAALTSEEARQQARAEGLTLRVGRFGRGYLGVTSPAKPGLSRPAKPYRAQVTRGNLK